MLKQKVNNMYEVVFFIFIFKILFDSVNINKLILLLHIFLCQLHLQNGLKIIYTSDFWEIIGSNDCFCFDSLLLKLLWD